MAEYITVDQFGYDEFTEKRSRFIGYCKPVKTQDEAVSFINEIKAKHWDAKHNVYAYILSDGQTIKAKSCGIVTKVETVVEQTTIKAMRLTVIEGDVEGQIVAGTYNHTTSTTKSYTYDLFDTKGSNHNGFGTSYYPIIGYGTVTTDATETVESTADTSDYKNLYYTIDLQSTYEDAIEAQEEKGETPR